MVSAMGASGFHLSFLTHVLQRGLQESSSLKILEETFSAGVAQSSCV